MVKERKCRKCGALIYKVVLGEGTDWLLTSDSPMHTLRSQNNRLYMDCAKCGSMLEFISVSENRIIPVDD